MRQKEKPYIVFFVEGDTDKVFFDRLIHFYRDHSLTAVHPCEIVNLKGASRLEDWLLDDIPGLCRYLKLKAQPLLQGSNGYQRIQSLFRHANKIYLKGNSVKSFVDFLNIRTIRDKRVKELHQLETALNVKLK